MNKRFLQIGLCLCLFVSLPAGAESLLGEGWRDIEELRLRQLQSVQLGVEPSPFDTDGCSGNLSAGWEQLAELLPAFADEFGNEPPWQHCCVAHDRLYWRGDAADGYAKRDVADSQLQQCIVDNGSDLTPQLTSRYGLSEDQVRQTFDLIAGLMHKAVRLGGQPCSLLPWRWGYGWPNCAFAKPGDRPAAYSDIKSDEQVVFFRSSGWLNAEKTHWNLPLHAWIYEPADSAVRKGALASLLDSKYDLQVAPATEQNFGRRTNLMLADNERAKKLVVRLAGRDYNLPESAENGHVRGLLQLPVEKVDAIAERGRVHFFAVTDPQEQRRFEGDVLLLRESGVSVISDIDDTIKISEVTDHRRLFDNTFLQDFKAVAGMAELYRDLSQRGVSIHFVSSSPWQLYSPLTEFADAAGFPWATMNLKALRFRDETLLNLFKKGTETKPLQIEPILRQYPGRRFILIGDSGEQDPEVYADIARRYPAQINRILIRNVDGSAAGDDRYRKAFENVERSLWRLFDDPARLSADELLRPG